MAEFKSIGLLGLGNMGGALAKGWVAKNTLPANAIHVFDVKADAVQAFAKITGCRVGATAESLLQSCEAIVLAVKPQVYPSLGESFFGLASAYTGTVISIMAGIPSSIIRKDFPKANVVRTMPNLGLSVGAGVTALESQDVSENALAATESAFAAVGSTVRVTASQMDAVTGLSGSGPMYVFEFIEGLILAGVKAGLSRDVAQELVLGTIRGSLKLLESGNDSPTTWTSRVCSPGGTTIHGLHVLENSGFRAALIGAVEAATKRSRELSGG